MKSRTGSPSPYPQSTLGAGEKVIREELGFEGWTRPKKRLPAMTTAAHQTANKELGEAAAVVDTKELQDLGTKASQVVDSVQMLETKLTDDILAMMNDPSLSLREQVFEMATRP